MTSERPDRRRVVRLVVPRHLTGPGFELRLVRLLDLSAEGARIEHPEHLHEGLACYVDLPPALGRGRLTGRVVWTSRHGREQTYEGETRVYYHSGLAFINLTAEQQAKLADALQILQTEVPDGK